MAKENRHLLVPRWRRQDIFCKKWFQFRIISYYILILLGGAAGLSYYIYRYAYRKILLEMFGGHSLTETPWEILRNGIFVINGVAVAAVIIAGIVTTFFITRSVARAAERLTENLHLTRDGGRSRDWAPPLGIYEFQHLQRLLDEALETHHVRVEELEMLARILQEKVREVRSQLERDGAQSCSRELRDLYVQCEKLKGAFDKFTVKKP